ncbi:nicotinate phosphoribosyltransferase [Shewanella gelidii]|uniref:Nicotinate phosphoribosyltransferase n=1 Tax=Shewanella gelidii TaxID=1642821 RepID=A0A917N9E6_9GAMM|nr:nicotinate phosphoribosyltransferase [Shewanella gelidii]MCL1097784.1 nicotinate phosphoribosyltransferase [Shewanella gelidii]GGI78799.1 nicotinate phosphoribosyltransferase [Shewanella gelidii]
MNTITPIINSLADTDAYKLHMQQAVYHQYPDAQVVAEFRCRDGEDLRPYQGEIEAHIHALGDLRFTEKELNFLAGFSHFSSDYLDFLKDFRLQPDMVEFSIIDGRLNIHIRGRWLDVILWEIPILAIVSEVRNRNRFSTIDISQALPALEKKVELVKHFAKQNDMAQFSFIDFGTRRRFSYQVQDFVIAYFKQHLPEHFVGTSNYHFAQKYNLSPVGTQAHEWFQAHQQLGGPLEQSQTAALESWYSEYKGALGIALTDCITMDAFLRDFDFELAERFQGLRHDSGDPFIWGEKAIAHYLALGINPQQKQLVFSDGLNLSKAIELHQHFRGRIQTSFGIGTNLTCDIPAVKPMNIVLKLIECNGKPVAKISDTKGKSMTVDSQYIAQLRQAFQLESYAS